MKQFVACGVAEKAFEAEATHQFDGFDVVIENDRFKAGRLHQTVDDLAEAAGTIGYEILTSLGARYARRYKDSG